MPTCLRRIAKSPVYEIEVVVARKQKWIGALMLALCVSAPTFAAVDSALELELQAPVAPSLDRPLQLAVALRNVGTTALILPNGSIWSEPHGLSLRVTQVNGPTRSVSTGPLPADETLPLSPGHAVDLSRTLDASDVFFAGAGDYVLTVIYTGPEGAVSSEPLRLSVH